MLLIPGCIGFEERGLSPSHSWRSLPEAFLSPMIGGFRRRGRRLEVLLRRCLPDTRSLRRRDHCWVWKGEVEKQSSLSYLS